MGMANVTPPKKRKPYCEGNIVCDCGSEYNPKTKFMKAFDCNGQGSTATPDYVKVADIPLGTCPSCGRKN